MGLCKMISYKFFALAPERDRPRLFVFLSFDFGNLA